MDPSIRSGISLVESDILELALKDLIDCSLKCGRSFTKCQFEDGNLTDERPKDESYARSLISHFMVKLNSLMGNGDHYCTEDEHTVSERDSVDTDFDDDMSDSIEQNVTTADLMNLHTQCNGNYKCVPSITMNGKHFGLYIIQSDQTETLNRPTRQSRGTNAVRTNSLEVPPPISADDLDDGYRSLSRSSYKINLMQQLTEIKSRVIDLVHELDQVARCHLEQDEISAYRRRRDALVSKLDNLIDSSSGSSARDSDSPMYVIENQTQYQTRNLLQTRHDNMIENSQSVNEYEEQEHVFDYSKKTKKSTNSRVMIHKEILVNAIDSQVDITRAVARVNVGSDLIEKNQATVDDISESSYTSGNKNSQTKSVTQHVVSSSSTSTYSDTSHASSSSFL